jgi:predicted naringenin-chalcone synthase
MAKIISIGTAVPAYQHKQEDILQFMQLVYAMNETDKRKLKFLYHQSGIKQRYSVISDYSKPVNEWKFYPHTENLEPFPSLEQRMNWFNKHAAPLSVDAIRDCIGNRIHANEITHLITVSCTGMSAPGLDLQVMELMDLTKNINRTSVNFMGCYAAIHALKMANSICNSEPNAKVLIVCTELCTLHFQREGTVDNITSSMLFGDGSAAVLVTHDSNIQKGLVIKDFYSEIISKGKKDMAWELSSSGFLMTLSGYIPELIEEDFESLVNRSLQKAAIKKEAVHHWCIHPGGKRILEAIHKSLHFTNGQLSESYKVLNDYGNMSSPTILFVLKEIMQHIDLHKTQNIFGAAFGPGLTMETFVASVHA